MAGNISDGLRRHWERHFKSLDKDGSDMLTVEELSRGLADRGLTISSHSLKVRQQVNIIYSIFFTLPFSTF